MLLYDRARKELLKHLRGKERRAMELAIDDAEASYAAACKASQARYEEIRPALDAAFALWKDKVKEATNLFFASMPREEVAKRMGYSPGYSPDSPTSVMNYCETYFREDRVQYHNLLGDLQKLHRFLLDKQEEKKPLTPKVTKRDTEARKLLTEWDTSKALCSTNPAPPTPNPDGSIDAERI